MIETREAMTTLGVPDAATGSQIYSTSFLQGFRVMRFMQRYRHCAHDHQHILQQIVAREIANGDRVIEGLRSQRDAVRIKRAIRQRDYWVEAAYRILALPTPMRLSFAPLH